MVLGIPLAKAAPLILKIVTKPLVETLKKEARKGSRWNNIVVLPLARCKFLKWEDSILSNLLTAIKLMLCAFFCNDLT